MTYEWDESKNLANKKKHDGIGFETAVRVFLDEKRIEKYDSVHSTETEDRWNVIGLVYNVLFVVYTERKDMIRIISQERQQKKRKTNTMKTMTQDELKNLPPLTEEEKKIIRDAKPTPTEDCPAMTAEELKEFRPWYARTKKTITINLDIVALDYFKALASETGVSYQNLINMYLLQCANEKKRVAFV